MRAVLILLCLAGAARAESDANRWFEQGRLLMKAGKLLEACSAFARSQELDPQFGTLYNLAGCYAKRELMVAAIAAYRDLAANDPNSKRRTDAAARLHELETRVPRLHVEATGARWTVLVNGRDITAAIGAPQPIDPGGVEIVATAPDQPAFRTTLAVIANGETTRVVIAPPPALMPREAPTTPAPITATPAPPPPRRTRTLAWTTLGAGAATITTGIVFGLRARAEYADARLACGGDRSCPSADATAASNALADRARGHARLADGFVAGGLVLAGIGTWLLVRGRSEPRLAVSPGTAATPAGVSLGGTF